MSQDYLGEFEQMVLLSIMRLGDAAYGLAIKDELPAQQFAFDNETSRFRLDECFLVCSAHAKRIRAETHQNIPIWISRS